MSTSEPKNHEPKNLADQAFDVYDRDGEEAMLAFILQHEHQGLNGDNLNPGRYILNDGTEIHWLGGNHPSYIARQVTFPQHRLAAIPLDRQPEYIKRTTPILHTPNSGDIMKELIERAENQAREELGLQEDPNEDTVLDLYDLISSTPNLSQTLRAAIDDQNQRKLPGRNMEYYLDAVVSECVDNVLRSLPTRERQTLVDRAKDKLSRRTPTLP